MNNISFNGRTDILYCLEKAAESAKFHEIAKSKTFGDAPLNLADVEIYHRTKLEAYLDSACHDDSFINTITHLTFDEKKSVAKNLQQRDTLYYIMKPLELFDDYLAHAFKKHHTMEPIEIKDDFIHSLDVLL